MKNGLVFGKFMPVHKGHLSLINFAKNNCDRLYVLVCFHRKEVIPGEIRLKWMKKILSSDINIMLLPFEYDENELPDTSVSSVTASNIWARAFKKLLPQVDVVFTSEEYGEYLAEAMQISHICYDKNRIKIPVSGSAIRADPFKYWDFICDEARPHFVKKIAILGSESTGKSILTMKLASYYDTVYVEEIGRKIVEKTELCTPGDLDQIAVVHAKEIAKQVLKANKLLFIDTDLNTTKSYSLFLFNQELNVTQWYEDRNKSDLYFFLETDCVYVQDGTRLSKEQREKLSFSHKNTLEKNGVSYISIYGNWEDRFNKVTEIINKRFFHR